MTKRWIGLGLIGASFALACSSEDDAPSGSADGPGTSGSGGGGGSLATSSSRCDMVSAADVKSILGIEDLSPPELIDESTYRAHCGFETPTNPLTVSVIYNINATQADYDLERNGYVENGI